MQLELSQQIFEKILKYQISWKPVPWEPNCSIRTDMTKSIGAFRNVADTPENYPKHVYSVDETRLHP